MPNWLFCAVESTIRYVPSTGKYSAIGALFSLSQFRGWGERDGASPGVK